MYAKFAIKIAKPAELARSSEPMIVFTDKRAIVALGGKEYERRIKAVSKKVQCACDIIPGTEFVEIDSRRIPLDEVEVLSFITVER